jgi:hypothetical protein
VLQRLLGAGGVQHLLERLLQGQRLQDPLMVFVIASSWRRHRSPQPRRRCRCKVASAQPPRHRTSTSAAAWHDPVPVTLGFDIGRGIHEILSPCLAYRDHNELVDGFTRILTGCARSRGRTSNARRSSRASATAGSRLPRPVLPTEECAYRCRQR